MLATTNSSERAEVIKHYAFGLAAASVVFLSGCATDSPPQTAETKNPCLGVAPATGTMLRKREDCNASSSMSEEEKERVKDEMHRASLPMPSPAKGGAGR
jgi:hypothetical protein